MLALLLFAAWELTEPGLLVWGPKAMWLVLAAEALPAVCAYWIYGWAQRIVGASRVAVALYLGRCTRPSARGGCWASHLVGPFWWAQC